MADEARHLLIAQLLVDGTLNDSQRAEIAGCSVRTIGRVRQELRREVESDEGVLDRFKRHLEKRLPVERCVDELVKLMEQDEHKPTKLAAIKRYQEILGMVTRREAKKIEDVKPQGPMFVFPEGSRPILNIDAWRAQQQLEHKSNQSEAIEAEVVRVSEELDD